QCARHRRGLAPAADELDGPAAQASQRDAISFDLLGPPRPPPPSTAMHWPVMNPAAGERRNAHAFAMSTGWPTPSGWRPIRISAWSGRFDRAMSVSMNPGITALTRI